MTQHHPKFIEVISILKPMLRIYPPLAVMHFDDLLDWMSWYWNRGTMAFIIEDQRPQGVCLIKLFRTVGQFMDVVHEPCGKFCFIELAIAAEPHYMGAMLEELEARWGRQDVMMWDRGDRTENGSPKMFRWKKFKRLARKLSNYGKLENA